MTLTEFRERRKKLRGIIHDAKEALRWLEDGFSKNHCPHEVVYYTWDYWKGTPVVCAACGLAVNGSGFGELQYWPKNNKPKPQVIQVKEIPVPQEDWINRLDGGDMNLKRRE